MRKKIEMRLFVGLCQVKETFSEVWTNRRSHPINGDENSDTIGSSGFRTGFSRSGGGLWAKSLKS